MREKMLRKKTQPQWQKELKKAIDHAHQLKQRVSLFCTRISEACVTQVNHTLLQTISPDELKYFKEQYEKLGDDCQNNRIDIFTAYYRCQTLTIELISMLTLSLSQISLSQLSKIPLIGILVQNIDFILLGTLKKVDKISSSRALSMIQYLLKKHPALYNAIIEPVEHELNIIRSLIDQQRYQKTPGIGIQIIGRTVKSLLVMQNRIIELLIRFSLEQIDKNHPKSLEKIIKILKSLNGILLTLAYTIQIKTYEATLRGCYKISLFMTQLRHYHHLKSLPMTENKPNDANSPLEQITAQQSVQLTSIIEQPDEVLHEALQDGNGNPVDLRQALTSFRDKIDHVQQQIRLSRVNSIELFQTSSVLLIQMQGYFAIKLVTEGAKALKPIVRCYNHINKSIIELIHKLPSTPTPIKSQLQKLEKQIKKASDLLYGCIPQTLQKQVQALQPLARKQGLVGMALLLLLGLKSRLQWLQRVIVIQLALKVTPHMTNHFSFINQDKLKLITSLLHSIDSIFVGIIADSMLGVANIAARITLYCMDIIDTIMSSQKVGLTTSKELSAQSTPVLSGDIHDRNNTVTKEIFVSKQLAPDVQRDVVFGLDDVQASPISMDKIDTLSQQSADFKSLTTWENNISSARKSMMAATSLYADVMNHELRFQDSSTTPASHNYSSSFDAGMSLSEHAKKTLDSVYESHDVYDIMLKHDPQLWIDHTFSDHPAFNMSEDYEASSVSRADTSLKSQPPSA